ncbi:MAG: hypothetical protein IJ124_03140 [Clostridia bacterium]|nr:hypothetical protein [Clostridia bacterium]
MMLLKNVKDIDNLIEAVNRCRGDVLLRSTDGREEFNLKSVLSRYVAIGELCKDHGDCYEVFCMDRSDEGYMINFFRNLGHVHAQCA